MKQLIRSLKVVFLLFCLLSATLLGGIIWQQNKSQKLLLQSSNENKQALKSRYAEAATVYSRDKVKLAYSEEGDRVYAENPELARSLIQTLGDYTHNIGNTIEGAYQDRLIATGRPWYKQIILDFMGKGKQGDDILLTIHSQLNLAAQSYLEGLSGSIVLLNYKTGEILVAVSTPNTYPTNVVNWENIPDSALFNRCFASQYAPGSTFKIITGTAWTRSPDYDPDYVMTCKGQEPLLGPGSVVENRNEESHGQLNMQTAFAVSCNHFFGDVGLKAGPDLLSDTAEEYGFNKSLNLGKLAARTGKYKTAVNDRFLLTWQAIGQPIDKNELTVSTLHLAMIAGAVANDGTMMTPYLIENFIDPLGQAYEKTNPSVFSQVSQKADLEAIKEDLIYTVNQGRSAGSYIAGYQVGGKTGTAESVNDNGEVQSNSLYAGFVADPDHPYAIGIVIENGIYDLAGIAGGMLTQSINLQP